MGCENMTAIDIISYTELLSKLEGPSSNHLLLGNGFNNSLGIMTNYSEIFDRMKQDYADYQKMEDRIKENGYDIEFLIKELKGMVQHSDDSFLTSYIGRKIKMDFMKATNEIVQENIKSVYAEKNKEIHLLLKNFTNYFTLNFDPFLYLLLMKFKKEKTDGNALAFQNTFRFIKQDLDANQKEIFTKIEKARNKGSLSITVDESKNEGLSGTDKNLFTKLVKRYFKDEQWSPRDIDRVCDQIWKQENQEKPLEVNDGFLFENFQLDSSEQNLFFLHGAFHINQKGRKIKKITQTQNAAFSKRLEKIIHDDNQDIVCVFTGTTEGKVKEIDNSSYLKKCLDELSNLKGALVILGCSLDGNDNHIFKGINQSGIEEIYISSCNETKEKDYKKALEIFTNKSITLFDYKTISYNSND